MSDSTVNPTAQDLATVALAQWSALQNGVLQEEQSNPTTYYPKRPWIDEPDGSVPFDYQQGLGLPAVGGSVILIDFFVDVGKDGVIKFMSNNCIFPFNDFSGDIQWQLLVNGKAVRNFDNMLAQKGTVGIPRPVSPIRLYSSDHVQVICNHLANVALNGNVVSSLLGYLYPSQGAS